MKLTNTMLTEYKSLWESMEIKSSWKSQVYRKAKQIYANKDKYEEIAALFSNGMPWYFIGIIHNLECGLDFSKHLHNGDSLARRTRRVPASRPKTHFGPFTFTESAKDALEMKGFDKVTDWSPEHMAYLFEKYNGFGYRYRRKTNPYLWSGSPHYTKGKFIRDHVFSASAVSEQIGCMPLLKAILDLDKTEDYAEASKNSRRLKVVNTMDKIIPVAGIGGYLSWENLNQVKTFVNDNSGWIVLGAAVTAWVAFRLIKHYSKQELKEGRYKTRRTK